MGNLRAHTSAAQRQHASTTNAFALNKIIGGTAIPAYTGVGNSNRVSVIFAITAKSKNKMEEKSTIKIEVEPIWSIGFHGAFYQDYKKGHFFGERYKS